MREDLGQLDEELTTRWARNGRSSCRRCSPRRQLLKASKLAIEAPRGGPTPGIRHHRVLSAAAAPRSQYICAAGTARGQ